MKRQIKVGPPLRSALAVFIVIASLPFWLIPSEYILSVAVLTLVYASAALGWNVIGGFGGLLSFGHSVYFGVGAYTSVLLYIHFGLTPWLGMLLGGVAAGLVGAATTFPALRLSGVYFALATFTATLLMQDLTVHYRDLTGGDIGLSVPFKRSAPQEFQFGSTLGYFYAAAGMLAIFVFITVVLSRSQLGYFLRASRDDEDAALAVGVSVRRTRLLALVLSSAMTGVSGAVLAQYLRFIDPATAFGIGTASLIALIALTGGSGTVYGPLIGAVVLIPLQQILSGSLSDLPQGVSGMAYAAVVIIVISTDRKGILHLLQRGRSAVSARLRSKKVMEPSENGDADEPGGGVPRAGIPQSKGVPK